MKKYPPIKPRHLRILKDALWVLDHRGWVDARDLLLQILREEGGACGRK